MIGSEQQSSIAEELFNAIFYNNRLKALSILDSGFDINTTNDLGQTPIYVAAAVYKNLPMVETLSRFNPDLEQKSDLGYTPLSRVLLKEDRYVDLNKVLKIIETLLRLGAKLTTDCNGALPIHIAITVGCHADIIRALLTEDTVNMGDHHGYFPLHLAILYDYFYVAKMLVDYSHTNVNVRCSDGSTPLILATRMDNERVVDLLLTYKADLYLKDSNGKGFLDYIIPSKKVDNLIRNTDKFKAILKASEESSTKPKNRPNIDLSQPGPSNIKISKRKKPYAIPSKFVECQYIESENKPSVDLSDSNSFTLPILQCKAYKLDTNPSKAPLGQLASMCNNLISDKPLELPRSDMIPSRSTSSQNSLLVNISSPTSSLSEFFITQSELSTQISNAGSPAGLSNGGRNLRWLR